MAPELIELRRVRVRVEGTVQGVGFRPHVFRLASQLQLGGWVRNDERGVLLEAEGDPGAVADFLDRLAAEAPPSARVERVSSGALEPSGGDGTFRIVESDAGGEAMAAVSPDIATCARCLAEAFDPANRRHRYPFINCTDCGPRFTIVRGVPYDRPLTTMADFEMCERCRTEYEDPGDRRFHAQPNACPECGPRLRLVRSGEGEAAPVDVTVGEPGADAIAAAAAAITAGQVLAVKGLGGYHLACLASDERAVAALRSRKHREQKPFAMMAPGLDAAMELAELGERARELLCGPERPIVIARRRPTAPVAPSVAPASPDIGVMLPYTPLHHLLAADVGAPLVMTSGNVSDEPIAFSDADALERLGQIADLLLVHDRQIATRTDDSVVRSTAAGPLLLRRSRGYAPAALALPAPVPPLLACGAELKNTFCVAKGTRGWVSHHVGDLENFETLTSFGEGVEHFQRLFAVEPELIVHDLHPEYLSSKYALARDGTPRLAVQHHHAHLAACLAEHGESGPALGAIYDGAGLGPDGTIWGGELLAGGLDGCERAGMLWPARLPGGAAAIREPWRMACSWLAVATGSDEPPIPAALGGRVDERRWREVCELLRSGVASPPTTSMGRLFDAVSAICGVRARVSFEGQAAVELEAVADLSEPGAYPLEPVRDPDRGLVLDVRDTVNEVARDAAAGVAPATISARFHNAIAAGTARALRSEAERRGLGSVVLSGGVFQNRLLLERSLHRLAGSGLRVLTPRSLPPNDGGISFGQAAIAAARPDRTTA